MRDGWKPFVLDVRRDNEAEISKLEFTDLRCTHDSLASVVDEIPKNTDLLVYCRSGGRSAMACAWLESRGYGPTTNLEGGINAWALQVDTSLTVY